MLREEEAKGDASRENRRRPEGERSAAEGMPCTTRCNATRQDYVRQTVRSHATSSHHLLSLLHHHRLVGSLPRPASGPVVEERVGVGDGGSY